MKIEMLLFHISDKPISMAAGSFPSVSKATPRLHFHLLLICQDYIQDNRKKLAGHIAQVISDNIVALNCGVAKVIAIASSNKL